MLDNWTTAIGGGVVVEWSKATPPHRRRRRRRRCLGRLGFLPLSLGFWSGRRTTHWRN